MCVYSMVLDYGQRIPDQQWDLRKWAEFQEIVNKAKKWDELMQQPNCEDPKKVEWEKRIEERLKRLENEKGILDVSTSVSPSNG